MKSRIEKPPCPYCGEGLNQHVRYCIAQQTKSYLDTIKKYVVVFIGCTVFFVCAGHLILKDWS